MYTGAKDIRNLLFQSADENYGNFQAKLVPTTDRKSIIGVRIPIIRKIAKTLSEKQIEQFLSDLPHVYLEENILHSVLISDISDYKLCTERLNAFLPFANSWAETDCISPKKAFNGHTADLKAQAREWMDKGGEFTQRYGIKVFMDFFLNENFEIADAKRIAYIRSEKIYVKLMIAWYFATALAKHYESIIPLFINPVMDKWTHNKAIQKAVESYRITNEQKQYLKTLKL